MNANENAMIDIRRTNYDVKKYGSHNSNDLIKT